MRLTHGRAAPHQASIALSYRAFVTVVRGAPHQTSSALSYHALGTVVLPRVSHALLVRYHRYVFTTACALR